MSMTPDSAVWLHDALTAAGDVAYEWRFDTDAVLWMGALNAVFGSGDTAPPTTGSALNARINAEDLPARLKAIADSDRRNCGYDCEYRLRRSNGAFVWVHDRGRVEFSEAGLPVRQRGILRVIDRRKAQQVQVELQVNFDELTGLPNRARLTDALQHAIVNAQRYSDTGGYLAVDIDGLAGINERYGYAAADAAIVEVAHRIERLLRLNDVVGRVGGDQFGIVLNQCSEADMAATADRVLCALRDEPVHTAVGAVPVTASAGGVGFPDFVKTAVEAMALAEAALADAKRNGRDRFARHYLSEAERSEHQQLQAVAERVKRELKANTLVLAFQPVVQTGSGTIRFYECLLRMVNPDGTIVAAGDFIPAVERLGLSRLVDRRVLEMTVEELRRYPDVHLSMNISGFTATDRAWLRTIAALLRDRPALAERLIVEITETAAIQDIEETARVIAAIRDLGCKVALDDFGTGYISFRHLKSLDVDIVKIAGSYVRDLPQHPENLQFIRSLITLAHGFGLETVAEGVETVDDVAALEREGVHMLQGWHYGRPAIRRPWLTAGGLIETV
jgi:diguanylate cyclase (GGDEF)-like protein